MVEQQIRTWEVLDQGVLDLLYMVPREEFVPEKHRALAFSDLEIPLEGGASMWQPKLEARVLQELGLRRTDRVLEVGTGSGYLTALLAHRAAHVHSVEISPALSRLGSAVSRHTAAPASRSVGDAARGWPSQRLTTSCAHRFDADPGHLPRATREGDRLFAVVGGSRSWPLAWSSAVPAAAFTTPRSSAGNRPCRCELRAAAAVPLLHPCNASRHGSVCAGVAAMPAGRDLLRFTATRSAL